MRGSLGSEAGVRVISHVGFVRCVSHENNVAGDADAVAMLACFRARSAQKTTAAVVAVTLTGVMHAIASTQHGGSRQRTGSAANKRRRSSRQQAARLEIDRCETDAHLGV